MNFVLVISGRMELEQENLHRLRTEQSKPDSPEPDNSGVQPSATNMETGSPEKVGATKPRLNGRTNSSHFSTDKLPLQVRYTTGRKEAVLPFIVLSRTTSVLYI